MLVKRGGQRGRPRKPAPLAADSPSSTPTGSRADESRYRSSRLADEDDVRESTSTSSVLTGADYDDDDDDDDPVILDDDDEDDSLSGSHYESGHHHRHSHHHQPGEEEEEEELVSPDDGRFPPVSIPVPQISIPLSLAHALTDAQTKIQLGDELVRLPCDPKLSVVAILEEYVHHFTFNLLSNPKWNRSDNYRNLNSSGYGSGSELNALSSSGGSAGLQAERGKPGGALPKVTFFFFLFSFSLLLSSFPL